MKYTEDLIKHLSEKTGLPVYEDIITTIQENMRNPVSDRYNLTASVDGFEYGIYDRKVKGGKSVIGINSYSFDAPFFKDDILPEDKIQKVFYRKYRGVNDFNIDINYLNKKHKYCEGNGWYSMKTIALVDGIEFIII